MSEPLVGSELCGWRWPGAPQHLSLPPILAKIPSTRPVSLLMLF